MLLTQAREKGTKIINEDGMLAMVKATVDLAPSVEQQAAVAAGPSQPTPMAVDAAEPDYRSSKPAPPPRAGKIEGAGGSIVAEHCTTKPQPHFFAMFSPSAAGCAPVPTSSKHSGPVLGRMIMSAAADDLSNCIL